MLNKIVNQMLFYTFILKTLKTVFKTIQKHMHTHTFTHKQTHKAFSLRR